MPVVPSGVGLGPVVAPTQWGDVVTGGRAAAVVGLGVVLVAGPGRSRAPGVHTAAVAFVDLVGEPVGDLVGVDPDVVVQILDRADHDLGVRVGAPGPDLFHGDRGAGVLAAAGLLVTQVHVDHHLARLHQRASAGIGIQVQAEVAAGDHPERHRAAHVQGLHAAGCLEVRGGLGDRGLEVQGVGQVQGRDHLWRGISKPLPVDGSRPTTPMVEPDSHLPRSRQRSLALAARPTIPTLAARPPDPGG